MLIKFYGVRGSIASPGTETVRYGGNTACVFVKTDDNSLFVFDAGTGIRKLGDDLIKQHPQKPINLLFSHYHWDHIQGFPFFLPAYKKNQRISLLAAHLEAMDAHSVLTQMTDPHFPVTSERLEAKVNVLTMDNGLLKIGENIISTRLLNHPGGGSAYRLETEKGNSMAYVTDNELYPLESPKTSYSDWVDFLQGVDLLIHDAMYLDHEKDRIHGWGHSLISHTLQFAVDANVKNLVLFHHDPSRTDQQLDEISANASNWMQQHSPSCGVFVAKEGDEYLVLESQLEAIKN
jgi:phosphoribosyl 1,2-cyclic phosphodiesterase